MGQTAGKLFSPDSLNVKGTGQTVGDLKGAGWTPGDMKATGLDQQLEPNTAQRVTRGILGGVAGGAKGYEDEQRGGHAPAAMPMETGQPQVDPSYFAPTSPYDPAKKKMFGQNNNMLIGG